MAADSDRGPRGRASARRPALAAAVDLGGTKIRSIVADDGGRVLGADERPTRAAEGLEAIVGRIVESVRAATAARGVGMADLRGIGVSAPGPVDFERGILLDAPNLPGWEDVPLASILSRRLGPPAFLENDANAAALGEQRFGAGRGIRHLLYLTISTGIGGGIIVNGALYRGADGTAGELGHIVVDERGPLHSCGMRGCLEVMASGTAIGRMAREAVEAGRSEVLRRAAARGPLTSREVREAAVAGDAAAREILAHAAHYLAIGLANFINIFNPELLVIGGGAAHIWDQLVVPAFDEARRMAFERPSATVRLLPAALAPDSGALGAAALALDGADDGWVIRSE
jgi:glucokinase